MLYRTVGNLRSVLLGLLARKLEYTKNKCSETHENNAMQWEVNCVI